MEKFFFDNWTSLLRTFTIGILAYLGLILLLRISGKRTLSKMNVFDFIVTIALGSTLATVLLNKNVPLADNILAFALLIFLQYAITWLSVRSKKVSGWVKTSPSLLVYRGQYLEDALKQTRVTKDETLAALRSQGVSSLDEVDAVVLETAGDPSVVKKVANSSSSVLQNLRKPF